MIYDKLKKISCECQTNLLVISLFKYPNHADANPVLQTLFVPVYDGKF